MRIVHVVDHFQPWMGYQETYLPIEQQRAGHDVWVITSDRYIPKAGGIIQNRKVHPGFSVERGIPVYRLKVILELKTHAGYVLMPQLEDTLKNIRPDVVHCHGMVGFTCLQVAVLQKKYRYRLVYDTHVSWINVFHTSEGRLVRWIKTEVYKAISRISKSIIFRTPFTVVAIGEPEQEFIRWYFREPQLKVPIIRLGADSQQYRFDEKSREKVRSDLGLGRETLLFGHAGSLTPSKGIETFIRAFASLKKVNDQPCEILLIGNISPGYRNLLERLCSEESISPPIFSPFTPKEVLPQFLSAIDVAVWAGDITVTAIEAMSVGLPVIASRTAYTEQMIENFKAGVLVQKGNVEDLTKVLVSMAIDPVLRKEMGANARNAVESNWNWQKIADQFIDIYREPPSNC